MGLFAEIRYDMIIYRNLLTALKSNYFFWKCHWVNWSDFLKVLITYGLYGYALDLNLNAENYTKIIIHGCMHRRIV